MRGSVSAVELIPYFNSKLVSALGELGKEPLLLFRTSRDGFVEE
jgi:hypothetical protein